MKSSQTWLINILSEQSFNWFVIEQNDGKLNPLSPFFISLLIFDELNLVNSITADDVAIETSWPMIKFSDNLAINLFVISDAILIKLKHLK